MKKKELTLQEIAEITQSKLIGDSNYRISNIADLEEAKENEIAFLANPRYEHFLKTTKAGAVFVRDHIKEAKLNQLIYPYPDIAFQKILEYFYFDPNFTGFTQIHPSAVIHPSAKIGPGVTISPNAVIDKEVVIGENTFIGASVFVGAKVRIGKNCTIYPLAVLRENIEIKDQVIIQSGAVIGGDGSGFIFDEQEKAQKFRQLGDVIIEENAEIGANSSVDRARFGSTIIGKNTKIGDLVLIAHKVILGSDNIIFGQSGVAGSTKTKDHVSTGGQVGIGGHLKIADHVYIAGKSSIGKNINVPGKYAGDHALPIQEYTRINVMLRNIGDYVKEINELKKRVGMLEEEIQKLKNLKDK